MSNIRISPDQMRARAGEFRLQATSVGESIRSMDRLLACLQEEWEGQASQSYASCYQENLKPSFLKAQELISEIADALDRTAQEMQDMDQRIASAFRA